MGGKNSGRKPHEPTAEFRDLVRVNAAMGMTYENIAKALGICRNTLSLHYSEELEDALVKVTAEVNAKLYQRAKEGNNTALKFLWDKLPVMIDWLDDEEAEPAQEVEDARPVKLGKKEQADMDAQSAGAGTDWGDDLVRIAAG